MKIILASTFFLTAMTITGTAIAAEPAISDTEIKPSAPTLPIITDDTALFEQFGGREGLTKIMDDVMVRWLANPRTKPFFENSDQDRIKLQLVEQFCVIMKGPCEYSGRTMAEAHRGMNVNEGSFYALVEELQITLNKMDVPFRAQNRLIAALAPMHRDIIDK
ncbi:group I truncated hemoglobin [Sphingorhabdus lacus]|jgi:hemoglobin|uniref:Group 1 truncated hemoglobin n=1 Tax=Sphingorhabdus lacus TaxID=392610 RepID=A0A6I6L5R2_9SPHN|nr:group 1 truncated hemoglobin [Sphingorhabdus lacus]QGY79561.1 group 1 truncated hemoglobin [Sphingorhabdus lacus]